MAQPGWGDPSNCGAAMPHQRCQGPGPRAMTRKGSLFPLVMPAQIQNFAREPLVLVLSAASQHQALHGSTCTLSANWGRGFHRPSARLPVYECCEPRLLLQRAPTVMLQCCPRCCGVQCDHYVNVNLPRRSYQAMIGKRGIKARQSRRAYKASGAADCALLAHQQWTPRPARCTR